MAQSPVKSRSQNSLNRGILGQDKEATNSRATSSPTGRLAIFSHDKVMPRSMVRSVEDARNMLGPNGKDKAVGTSSMQIPHGKVKVAGTNLVKGTNRKDIAAGAIFVQEIDENFMATETVSM